jgi:hypothetical protein
MVFRKVIIFCMFNCQVLDILFCKACGFFPMVQDSGKTFCHHLCLVSILGIPHVFFDQLVPDKGSRLHTEASFQKTVGRVLQSMKNCIA